MSNDVAKKEEALPTPSAPIESGTDCQMSGKGWLNGGLMMAICCKAPLLVVGAIASGALSLTALLACPIGMFLMMRMMMKDKK